MSHSPPASVADSTLPSAAASPAPAPATGHHGLPRLALKPVSDNMTQPHVSTPSPSSTMPTLMPTPTATPRAGTTIMSKEWVVPPRPKPGRKPATDTPPTKRKAQNRVAQRAFRERRAARVGELEEYIRAIEEEHARALAARDSQVADARSQVDRHAVDLEWWKNRCRELEEELIDQRRETETSMSQGDKKSAPQFDNNNQPPLVSSTEEGESREALSCGKCSPDDCKCMTDVLQIPDPSIELDTATDESFTSQKDQPLTSSGAAEGAKSDYEDMEIDFTTHFSSTGRLSDSTGFGSSADDSTGAATFESCGFCQEGTSCVCAEMAQERHQKIDDEQPRVSSPSPPPASPRRPRVIDLEQIHLGADVHGDVEEPVARRMPTIQSLTRFTPPPDDGAESFASTQLKAERKPAAPTKRNPCANGPGTCEQCQRDPASTLFCKVLASNGAKKAKPNRSERNLSAAGAGCPGRRSSSGCCKSSSRSTGAATCASSNPNANVNATANANANTSSSSSSSSSAGKFLNCADSYTVLSRHPQFSRATNDLSSWVPRLNIQPNTSSASDIDPNTNATATVGVAGATGAIEQVDQRPAIEVEAASVMNVLRYFDRRFAD